MSRLAQNYKTVKDRIEKASAYSQSKDRNLSLNYENSLEKANVEKEATGKVRLIAVSKTRQPEELRELYQCGQTEFGENYLQEALEKISDLKDLAIQWHFIGPVQSNKTRQIAENFDWIHTVDRIKIAQRLNAQRPQNLSPLNLCIQINIDDESTKSGVTPENALELAKVISELPRLRLRGLMFIPAPQENYESQLKTGQKAKAVFSQVQYQYPELDTLSLGMSSDLEAAIAAGSNMVRIGTDIFGARDYSST